VLNNHHLASFASAPAGVSARFIDKATGQDAGTYEGSLLIAADGIHSAVRAKLYPEEGAPIWNGRILWRGITETEAFLSGRTMIMAGHESLKFVCYPISGELPNGKRRINWIAERYFPPEHQWRREDYNRAAKLEEFLPWFEDWHFDWLDVPGLIRTPRRPTNIRWSTGIPSTAGPSAMSRCSAMPRIRCIRSALTVPRRPFSMLACSRARSSTTAKRPRPCRPMKPSAARPPLNWSSSTAATAPSR
jgi:hypothetical protein